MGSNIKINGFVVKNPTSLKIEKYKLSKSGRLASGLMTMDIIAPKKKFVLQYDIISGIHLKAIVDLLDNNDAFYTFVYTDYDGSHTYTVYPGALNYDRFRMDGITHWKNFEFSLVER